jgi:Flp pilus assembly protein TadD
MPTITVAQALQTAGAFQRAGQLAAAEALYRQIVASDPGQAEAWHALGSMALFSGRVEEAVGFFAQAIARVPAHATYHSDLGIAYRRSGRLGEAVASFRQAVALKPDFAEAHSNLGRALVQLGRIEEAIASGQRAVAANPGLPEAHLNLGAAFLRDKSFAPAIEAFRRAIALRPDFSEAHRTLSFILLLLGQYEEGWKEHEWRWQCPVWSPRFQSFVAPRWDGRPVPGATIWLHAEQGFGDAIHFLRYVPLVRERSGAEVALLCPPQLGSLLAADGNCPVPVIATKTLDGATLPATDRHLPLLSLPAVLGLFEPLPMAGPYLRADPQRCANWRERLRTVSGLHVGVAWAGNPSHQDDRARSMEFPQIAAILDEVPGVTLVNLQVDSRGACPTVPAAASRWIDFTAELTDFAETAALMAELDLIISVDTAAAHLAGALGRPVWTLLPFIPDWRWGLDREDTPWYPTMRLFRQQRPGAWDGVIQRVVEALRGMKPEAHQP